MHNAHRLKLTGDSVRPQVGSYPSYASRRAAPKTRDSSSAMRRNADRASLGAGRSSADSGVAPGRFQPDVHHAAHGYAAAVEGLESRGYHVQQAWC